MSERDLLCMMCGSKLIIIGINDYLCTVCSSPDAEFAPDSAEGVAMGTIIAACEFAKKAEIHPLARNGHEFYLVAMPDGSMQKVSAMRARADWRDYYRSVRTLRRMRQGNMKRFLEFSALWYKEFYQLEDKGQQLELRIAEVAAMRANRKQRKLP